MNRHLAYALLRLFCTLVSAFVAFELLHEWSRRFEARAVARVMTDVGITGANQVYGSRILVRPSHAAPFLATVTPSCSALGAVLTFIAIAVFMLHGPLGRRVLAVAVAAGVVTGGNMVRISLALVVGLHAGSHAMVVFHDWVGTALGLLSILAGFTFFVFVLLPSNRKLLEAALGK